VVAIKGHFDGRVIVPDEPLNLPENQRLIAYVEALAPQSVDFRTWIGQAMACPQNPKPKFTSDRELWEPTAW